MRRAGSERSPHGGEPQDLLGRLRAAVPAAALLCPVPVATIAAQSADPVLEEIVVTGTRIARRDFESASPIVSVDADLFKQAGAPTVETVLNTLPQFVPSFTSSSNNPGSDGQANLSLRGLPITSTLVLMDGRRVLPANGNGVVDVNVIPGTLIETVEVITGGASAVYGSDAVAGVVNFKLRKEFDGVEVGGYWGQSGRGDAGQWEMNLTAGTDFAGGRGNVFGSASHAERDQLNYDARSYSQYSLGYVGPGLASFGPDHAFESFGSGNIEEGRARLVGVGRAAFDAVFANYGYPPGTVPLANTIGIGFNNDRTVFSQGTGAPRSVANFRGEIDPNQFNDSFYTYNFAPDNALQLPLERNTVFAGLRFDLSDGSELYAQGLYADYSSDQQLAPTPATGIFIPTTNPYIPEDLKPLLASRPDPDATFDLWKRLTELGARQAFNEYDVFQITAGASGRLLDRWRWDAYVQYGENDQVKRQNGNALRSRIEDLTFAADGGAALCGGFDPFGLGSISQECADYIKADGSNRAKFEQFIGEASLSGPLAELPAGTVSAAVGVFYKDDEYFYRADPVVSRFLEPDENVPLIRPDIIGFNASDDVDGQDSNADLYVELAVPLLAELPGVKSLEIVAGYRYSDYDSAGSVDAYKAELLYRPVQPVSVRASFQHAVRAPSIFELYLPQLPFEETDIFNDDRFDPCRIDSPERSGADVAAVEALCLAQGVPAGRLADLQGDYLRGFQGGNPDLNPEQADTYTIGAVFQSPFDGRWVAGLQVSIDWYRIEIEDAIAEVRVQDSALRCFDSVFNREFAVDNDWCTHFGRDPLTGEIVDAGTILRNVAGISTEGIDLQIVWEVTLGPGDLSANWLVSWLDSFERLAAVGTPPDEFAGTIGLDVGSALPEWKALLNLTYTWQALSVTARWQYIDGLIDTDVPDFHVPSYDYFDLYASYEFEAGLFDGLTLRAGIDNLTDEDPPIYPSYVQANTDPSQYDPFGRRYHVGLSYRF
jgi:outer membrane receptor protein involved in Fe transport